MIKFRSDVCVHKKTTRNGQKRKSTANEENVKSSMFLRFYTSLKNRIVISQQFSNGSKPFANIILRKYVLYYSTKINNCWKCRQCLVIVRIQYSYNNVHWQPIHGVLCWNRYFQFSPLCVRMLYIILYCLFSDIFQNVIAKHVVSVLYSIRVTGIHKKERKTQ